MSQNDFTIANQSAPDFRSDLNDALQALASLSSGATAPSTTYANMLWYDISNNILKMRSEADDAWISIGYLDQSANAFRILDDTQVVNTSGTQTGLIGDQSTGTWETGTSTTESLVSPAKVKAAARAARTEVSEVATTSGTSVDIITGIPSGVNSIDLYFYDISISAADFIVIQLGTSVSYSTSGYIGEITQGSAGLTISTGLPAVYSVTAANTGENSGLMRVNRVPGTNKWVAGAEVALSSSSGSIDLGAQLTRLRVTTNSGTATFDNGGISARYY